MVVRIRARQVQRNLRYRPDPSTTLHRTSHSHFLVHSREHRGVFFQTFKSGVGSIRRFFLATRTRERVGREKPLFETGFAKHVFIRTQRHDWRFRKVRAYFARELVDVVRKHATQRKSRRSSSSSSSRGSFFFFFFCFHDDDGVM